jgi:RNA polymerase sigma-70 factor (ECF subfamily)
MELVRPALAASSTAAERSISTEHEFRLLYERTAQPLRAYLYRMLSDASRADDILQETYLRFLQAKLPADMTEEHRKNYLFRIATNLLHNEAGARTTVELTDHLGRSNAADDRLDSVRCLEQLSPRQRELLWLAYVEEFTHKEIAGMLGIKAPSIRPMLARARERLSEILKRGGWKRK